jgi:hypothetical protein
VQGYLISRPISFDAFRQYLRDDKLHGVDDQRASLFSRPASFWKSG